ncbi:MAG: dTMP kinase [Gaiellaceae bacterium]
MFVTFEGIDGSGKSTQVELLRAELGRRSLEVVATREPGGTELGEGIRELVLQGPDMTSWAEALLFAAARAELVAETIRPALERGAWVLSDRYFDSSLAYQGVGRDLGIDPVLELNLAVTHNLVPDRTFVLAITAEEALARAGGAPDRLEAVFALQALAEDGYEKLASLFPERIVKLDATRPAEETARDVREHLGLS